MNDTSYMVEMKSIKMASLNSENNGQILLSIDIDVQGTARMILCCDDTMLLNPLMSLFKKAILSALD